MGFDILCFHLFRCLYDRSPCTRVYDCSDVEILSNSMCDLHVAHSARVEHVVRWDLERITDSAAFEQALAALDLEGK